ncbi:MAG: SLBB domain-containing protein [Bacilli bacterium]|nr:SLBB domain-containing protein [Bacilli bacterium]
MAINYIDDIKQNGVVGAGGAGFPTHVKLNAKAKIVIINGAECEPLLKVDQQLLEFYPNEVIKGLKIAMRLTGADHGYVGVKKKYKEAVNNLNEIAKYEDDIEIKTIGDYYPAGDEVQLVYEITNQRVPLMGIPLDVGVVVINTLTAINIANGKPVTERVVTIAGEVTNPKTMNVPVGTTFRELIIHCGGPKDNIDHAIIIGGPMMGSVEEDWDTPVSKLTSGIIVLPKYHHLIRKKTRKTKIDLNLTKAICCQCFACTDLCPKFNLGMGVKPHQAMRGLANDDPAAIGSIEAVAGCNNCNLCTYYACPMDLDPGKITTLVRSSLVQKGVRTEKIVPDEVDELRSAKKVPTKRLKARLDIVDYDIPAPLDMKVYPVSEVYVPLKQHIGVPASPIVNVGDQVSKGQIIGTCGDQLGANVHASIDGVVVDITEHTIHIKELEV